MHKKAQQRARAALTREAASVSIATAFGRWASIGVSALVWVRLSARYFFNTPRVVGMIEQRFLDAENINQHKIPQVCFLRSSLPGATEVFHCLVFLFPRKGLSHVRNYLCGR